MDDDSVLDELLDQWEAARGCDRPASPEELCESHPELLDKLREAIAKLEFLDDRIGLNANLGPSRAFERPSDDQSNTFARPRRQVDSSSASREPARIGHYRLLQELGEGGMGTVWLAEQDQPVRRRVALKLIKAGQDSKQVIARFEAERQALALMDHPNIAKILDAGRAQDGRPYFVMELVQGVPFSKYCDQNKLSIPERMDLFISVCRAVQHAHQRGIIHRDLKPSNVLICLQDGKPVPKVIDFGLAKALQPTIHLTDKTLFTEFGQVVGTVQYMSPEQAEMSQLDIDTRTDVYSLGVMLYELLTGTTPIDPETLRQNAILKVLAAIRENEPPRPSMRLSSSTHEAVSLIAQHRRMEPSRLKHVLRGELDWIVMKALEKDRTRRYESASAFAEDLANYLQGNVVAARPPSTAYLARKYIARNKGLVGSLSAIVLLLIGGVISTTWFALDAQDARDVALETAKIAKASQIKERDARIGEAAQRKIADEQRTRATEAANSARLKLMELFCEKGDTLLENDRRGQAMLWYAGALRLAEACEAPQLVHRERLASILRNSPRPRWLETFDDRIVGVRITSSGRFAAMATSKGLLHIVDVSRRTRVCPPIKFSSDITCLDVHHDEEHVIAGCTDGTVAIHSLASGEQITSRIVHLGGVRFVTYSKDGRLVLSGGDDKTCKLWDWRTEMDLVKPLQHNESVSMGQLSHDGSTIITGTKDHLVHLWNARSGERIGEPLTQPPERNLRSIVISADGKRAVTAAGGGVGGARIWDRDSGVPIFSIPNAEETTALAFSHPDGKRIITNAAGCQMWDLESLKVVTEFKTVKDSWVSKAEFDQEGSLVALVNGRTIHIRSIAKDHKASPDLEHDGEVAHVDVSGDGRYVVSSTANNVVRIWDLAFGGPTQLLLDETLVHAITFDSQGRYLLSGGEGGLVCVWDPVRGTLVHSHMRHSACVRSIYSSPDGRWIGVICDDFSVTLWDGKTFEKIATLTEGSALAPRGRIVGYSQECTLQFTQDGKKLLGTLHNGHVLLWDLSNMSLIREFDPGYQIVSAHLSPDETQVVTCSMVQRAVHLWDLRTGKQLREWTNPESARYRWVRFTPRGEWLVLNTMGSDTTVGGTSFIPLLPTHQVNEVVSTHHALKQIDYVVDGVPFRVNGLGSAMYDLGLSQPSSSAHSTSTGQLPTSVATYLPQMANEFMVQVVSNELTTGNHLHPFLTTPGMPAFHLVASAANGRKLAVAARWMNYIEYRDTTIQTDMRPVAYWQAAAELLAGRRFNEHQHAIGLKAEEIAERWRTVTETHENEWLADASQVWNWHHALWSLDRFSHQRDQRKQASILAGLRPDALAFQQLSGAAQRSAGELNVGFEQMKRVAEQANGYTPPWLLQAEILAMREQWSDAAALYSQALSLRADRYIGLEAGSLILCCLASGDRERLAETLRNYWDVRSRLKKPDELNKLVWYCCLSDQSVVPWPDLVPLAQKAIALAPKSPSLLNTRALLHYRAGEFAEARTVLLATNESSDESFANCAVLAMCCAKLKDVNGAKEWLAKSAAKTSVDDTPWSSQTNLSSKWRTLLTERLLLEEARETARALEASETR